MTFTVYQCNKIPWAITAKIPACITNRRGDGLSSSPRRFLSRDVTEAGTFGNRGYAIWRMHSGILDSVRETMIIPPGNWWIARELRTFYGPYTSICARPLSPPELRHAGAHPGFFRPVTGSQTGLDQTHPISRRDSSRKFAEIPFVRASLHVVSSYKRSLSRGLFYYLTDVSTPWGF